MENTPTTTTKRMMMMMMKNKPSSPSSSSSSTPTNKNPTFNDDQHHDDNNINNDETPIFTTEEKKQKRYTPPPPSTTTTTTTNTTTSAKRCSPNSGGGGGGGVVSCQAEKCTADLGEAKRYHRRHKVCEFHAKAPSVLVSGLRQRFCQQCSRFHELSEFDETKRSCRRRLAGHNERRRKNSADQGESGSSSQTKGSSPQLRAGDHERANGKSQIPYAGTNNGNTSSYKQFQIR